MAKFKRCPFCGSQPIKTKFPHRWEVLHKKGCRFGNPYKEQLVTLYDRFKLLGEWMKMTKRTINFNCVKPGPMDQIYISEDTNLGNGQIVHPCILYTPNTHKPEEHYHIDLSRSQARGLMIWLQRFLRKRH